LLVALAEIDRHRNAYAQPHQDEQHDAPAAAGPTLLADRGEVLPDVNVLDLLREVAQRVVRGIFAVAQLLNGDSHDECRTHRPHTGIGQAALARRSARYITCGSPRRRRSSRSSPAIGYRFCGARGSLWGWDANRGNVAATRSASAMTRSVLA